MLNIIGGRPDAGQCVGVDLDEDITNATCAKQFVHSDKHIHLCAFDVNLDDVGWSAGVAREIPDGIDLNLDAPVGISVFVHE